MGSGTKKIFWQNTTRNKELALKEGHKVFSYGEIAKKSLEPVKATSVIHSAKQW
jgi:hypothetical protein